MGKAVFLLSQAFSKVKEQCGWGQLTSRGFHSKAFFFIIDQQRILSHRQSLEKPSGGDIEWSGPELFRL